ncbi:MAG: NAD(P)-dependent oxidoreductase [Spirochaetes bacterium]|nr:MAG: NAD(P)-dependent oxidoreductase [Spirochaetota bacterium]
MNKTAAVIGTGIMGTGIGKTLIRDGWKVNCYNRTRGNADSLVSTGAQYCATPSEAASGVDFVILMPWDINALKSVLEGENGLFANAAKGQIFIDMSTQLPETALWEADGFSVKGAEFLDAPVHGTKGEANGGGLWIMTGGKREVYEKTVPLLEVLGETHHYMGGYGKGYASKLCGNHLVSTIVAALGESMVLAEKAGIDRTEILKLWMESDFRSPVVDGVGNSIISRDFDVSFHLRTMVKDTELIRNFSESIQVPVLLANTVHEVNKIGLNKGWGEENASAVVKVFEDMAGLGK